MHIGQHFVKDLLHPSFVCAVHIGIDKADGDGFDIALLEDFSNAACLIFVQIQDNLAGGINSLLDRQPVATRDIGLCHIFVGIPQVFFVGATDFDHIAKPFGTDHGRTRQLPGNERVRGHRCTVGKHCHLRQINLGLGYARHDRAHRVIRCGRCFFDTDLPRILIHDAYVSECATDIDCNSCFCHYLFPSFFGPKIQKRQIHAPKRVNFGKSNFARSQRWLDRIGRS